jgi:hypothetical protein
VGWVHLVKLEGKRRKPRPRHVQADAEAQEAFKKSSARSSARSRPRSPTHMSSSGRQTNTVLGENPSCTKSGVSTSNAHWPRSNTAMNGATWWASCIRPQAAPSFIWRPR